MKQQQPPPFSPYPPPPNINTNTDRLTVDTLVNFKIFDEEGVVTVDGDDGDKVVVKYLLDRKIFMVEENGETLARVDGQFKAPRNLSEVRTPIYHPFTPPKL